jgi:hypothetical protein
MKSGLGYTRNVSIGGWRTAWVGFCMQNNTAILLQFSSSHPRAFFSLAKRILLGKSVKGRYRVRHSENNVLIRVHSKLNGGFELEKKLAVDMGLALSAKGDGTMLKCREMAGKCHLVEKKLEQKLE